jgi:membrane fusion protein, multidrug efflux system
MNLLPMSSPHHRITLPILALLVLSAVALSGCKKSEAAPTTTVQKVKVETVPATEIETPAVLRLTGNLKGERETELAANVSGRVLETLVERGGKVTKGQIIARIDTSAASLQLAEAKVQIATTETQTSIDQVECERYQKLKERGAVTDLEYSQVMARCQKNPLSLDAAKARASIAAKNVGDGVIRAPFAGVVTDRFIEVGEYVQPNTRVVSIANVDSLRLEFSVPEANYPAVKQDSEGRFVVAAYGEREFSGKVIHIGGAIRNTRDVLVEAEVPNNDGQLLPGMFANVSLIVGSKRVAAVPAAAVFQQNAKPNAFAVKNGVLEQRVLQVSTAQDGMVPVLAGIAVGEPVVAIHKAGLANGQAVE